MNETMQGLRRTKYCGLFTTEDIGKEAVACGWVQRIRDKGMLVFVDLRDRTGILQLAFDDATEKALREKAQTVRSEYVLMAKGIIRRRESVNHDIPTGEIELYVQELRILNQSLTPPFEISDRTKANDEIRLRYRYLDLRRGEMQHALMMRHKIVKTARDYFDENGFLEIETPCLIKSTPEGARDYLVPSRVKPGSFFALPQSPQLYKQLLMLSGYDRYMQIARCFRDEDLRADRQPEFTQIDLEMSFIDEDDVMTVNEGFMKRAFKEILDVDIPTPFLRMPYQEAMDRFGSDKPDTRFGMELQDLSGMLKDCTFKVFAGALETGSVRAINAKGAADKLTRKEIDKLVDFVKTYRAKGLAFTRLTKDAESSSYEKFLTEEEKQNIRTKMDAQPGDVILIVADPSNQVVYDSLGALRCELAKRLDLIPKGVYNFLWVTEFPLFEYSEEENRYVAKHHPFTHPALSDLDKLESDPGNCHARAYDMVLNGCEVGGGSIRINDPELQAQMFRALGFDNESAQAKFGFLIDAFQYGAPPHGGMAYGLDRLVMLMLEKDSIRDVIAFPKVQNSSELMTQCPAEVEEKSLQELHIKVDLAE
ncbi:aspartate--tRNA ligase [bacterium 1XD42-1]|nr:aspartate--tRNA ligase [Oscillospiraceae bacterium]MCI9668250.1 aspartate--tRNA ligase [Oscillospiraceae bacterium]RKJ59050.1 aspartate--tRNA ligase [bacterium 1XD42-8]RKJ67235.1 aspartate--tRNA ligase [bacterium 1XD42-1]